MKRLIFCAALVMAALASCSKTEVIYDGDSQEIGFKVAAGPMSKAPIEGTTLTSGQMVVYAASSDEEGGPYNTSHFDNEIFIYQAPNWKGETPQYWPSSGYLKFMAYYPSGIGTATGSAASTPIVISGINNASAQNDILYTALSAAQSASSKAVVPMTFKHALAQILVTFKATHPDDNIVVTSVAIEKPNLSGILSLDGTQATWNTNASLNDLTMNKNNALNDALTAEAQNYGSGALVMPGSQTKLKITYTIDSAAPKTETITLSGTWDMGKKYIYNITFANEILINATVEDWDAQSNKVSEDVTID